MNTIETHYIGYVQYDLSYTIYENNRIVKPPLDAHLALVLWIGCTIHWFYE